MQRYGQVIFFIVVTALSGCRRQGEEVPLIDQKIYISDKFYDVDALSPEKAVVIGYGGKILFTADGGKTWQEQESGTELALSKVEFIDDMTGWIVGQQGLILHTEDGGKTWRKQESGTQIYLFSSYFLDRMRGWAVGDKATYVETFDGGKTWQVRKIEQSLEGVSPDVALAMIDPILYDVEFLDAQTGWVVGEFGKIFHTTDGGATWQEQQAVLVGQGGIVDPYDLPTFFGVHFKNPQDGIAVGLEGRIARTTDGGATWTFETMNLAVPFSDPLYDPAVLSDGTGWAVGAAGKVLKTKNGSWEPVDLGMEVVTWLRAVDFADNDHGWIVGGLGLILRTDDGGKTWIPCAG